MLYPELSVCRYTVEIQQCGESEIRIGYQRLVVEPGGSLLPGVGYDAISEECVTIPFDAAVSADKTLVTGSLLAFGHCAATQNAHQLTIYAVLADESKWYYTYDVTDQIHSAPDQRNVHIVLDGFRCPSPSPTAAVSSPRWSRGSRGDRFKNVMIVHVMDRKMSYYLLFNPFIFFKMKQKLFFIAVAAMGMASCSQDESTGINNGNAIDFRAALGTRAVETTTANLDKIVVTAIDKNDANYFTDAEFTKNDAFFTSTPAYYWPGDGSDLSFYAYSPAASDLGATVTINSTTKTLADFSPASRSPTRRTS